MPPVEYSPWIEHDGKGFPLEVMAFYSSDKGWTVVERQFSQESGSRTKTPKEAAFERLDPSSPSWRWIWKGGFFFKRRRVCIEPEYHPTIKYRFVRNKPRAAKRSREAERLIEAVSSAPETFTVTDPEETKEKQDATSHLDG